MLQDVVLPLPGGRVRYPSHEAGWKLYCRMAAADGVLLPGMSDADAAAAAAVAAAEAGGASPGQHTTEQQQQQQPPVKQQCSHGVKDFQLSALSGDYRRLLHVPCDMQHHVVKYADPDQVTTMLDQSVTSDLL